MSIKISKTSFWNIKVSLVKSHGSYIFDERSNREYLDFFGMYSSLPLGYNHEIFDDEFYSELKGIAHVKLTNCEFDSSIKDEFINDFHEFAGCGIYENYHFTCTGALAVECACKLSMDYTGGSRIVSVRNSFHGVQSYGNFTTDHFSPVDERLSGFPNFGWPKISTAYQLRHEINNGSIAGIIIEPIQSTVGDNYLNKDFLSEIADIAKINNIPLIFDEIQTGFGVTGKPWYFQHLGITPDIVVFGKKSQVSGIMSTQKLSFKKYGRACVTFDGDLIDMLRCKYIIKAFKKYELLKNATVMGDLFKAEMLNIRGLLNVRNSGLLVAVDFSDKIHRDYFSKEIRDLGMICNPTAEKTVRFRPNMSISELDIKKAVCLIDTACKNISVRDNYVPLIPF